MINEKKERESNLELYRIIIMILIIAHHYVVNSGLTNSGSGIYLYPYNIKSIYLLIFGAWGKTGINCFVLITGYYMCKSNISIKKFLKLLFQIYFYNIIITSIFFITKYEPITLNSIFNLLFPFRNITVGFTTSFLVFYLTIPFLTILVNNLTQGQHKKLILLIFIFFICFDSLPKFSVTFSYVSWFMCLFIISSYIRLYPNKYFNNTSLWGWLTLLSLFISITSIIVFHFISTEFHKLYAYYWISDSNKILAVITSLTSFLFFKNIKIGHSKIINKLGGSTFGVLLIHANSDTMRKWLWQDLLHNVDMYYSNYIFLHSICSVLIIFIVCSIIELIRQKFIEKYFFKLYDKILNKIKVKSTK